MYPKLFGRPSPNSKSVIETGMLTYGIIEKTIFEDLVLQKSYAKVSNFCSIAPGVMPMIYAVHHTNLAKTFPLRTIYYPSMGMKCVVGRSNLDAFSDLIEIDDYV